MTTPVPDDPPPQAAPTDATSLLRSAAYLRLLVIAAVLGVPISAVAYWFLVLTKELGSWLYSDLPRSLSLDPVPAWWPLPLLGIAGLLVGLLVRFVPGRGGESPLDGFHPGGGPPAPLPLLGIALAAVVSLGFGAVVGPEAPLIAIGGGLAAATVRLARRDAPDRVLAVVAAAGSFAAISALFGSPLSGAFLLMEAVGIGGPMLRPILLPGLLASGIGTLVFIGLDSWTGRGTFSLALPDLPPFPRPDVVQLLWAPVIGLAAAVLVALIRRIAVPLRTQADRRVVVAAPLVGLAVAGLAMIYVQLTGHGLSDVLFSGQDQLPGLVSASADYTVGALLLLIACKSLAFAGSLVAFRGGPTFPAIFLGAAGGIALSHLPGLSLVPAIAMGLGATAAAMLQLPLTSVLVATIILGTDGFTVMPLVIIAVTVSYVASARLAPRPATPAAGAEAPPATTGAAGPVPQARQAPERRNVAPGPPP